MFQLYSHQLEAVEKMHNGCILVGDVGTGKSRTALAYFILRVCSDSSPYQKHPVQLTAPRDLYIITTAKKRDNEDWLYECIPFGLSDDPELSACKIRVTVDSWNNIKKYVNVVGAFFIFDEQRVVGSGAWVKAFYKITNKNQWVLLSATPGDSWSDYIPVFVANHFYKNKTDFNQQHVIFSPFVKKYPKIDRYVGTKKLERLREALLIEMIFDKETTQTHIYKIAKYDKTKYKTIWRDRWDPYDNEPIQETGKLFYLLRKAANADPSRIELLEEIMFKDVALGPPKRFVIFYNFDYELEILKDICERNGLTFSCWNGHAHEEIPQTEEWAYLVQYTAGAEGWNCIATNKMIFYSQTYSYKMLKQSAGRIDRMNTPFERLYYYHLRSAAPIDIAIARALNEKRNFNERRFLES